MLFIYRSSVFLKSLKHKAQSQAFLPTHLLCITVWTKLNLVLVPIWCHFWCDTLGKLATQKPCNSLGVKDRQYGQYTVLQDVISECYYICVHSLTGTLEGTFRQTSSQLQGNSCHYTKNISNFLCVATNDDKRHQVNTILVC
jgi:hypothetical protein